MNSSRRCLIVARALYLLAILPATAAFALTPKFVDCNKVAFITQPTAAHGICRHATILSANSNKHSQSGHAEPGLQRVPVELEGVPIPFVDIAGRSFIECYADSIANINGVQYTIGVPCDNAVALCYYNDKEDLVPIELDDEIMDDVFSIAEGIVSEGTHANVTYLERWCGGGRYSSLISVPISLLVHKEFGEELLLQRTPQTLTLVGELEEDKDEDEDEASLDDDDDTSSEEVEMLLSFEHQGKEYNLVRLLNPLLLVGKLDEKNPVNRLLLTPEEADSVMPTLVSQT